MDAWLDQLETQIAEKQGIVRLNKSTVANSRISLADLVRKLRQGGGHLIETGEHYIVVCNAAPLLIHCGTITVAMS